MGESDADMIREILFSIDAEKEEALRELEWAQTRVIINDFHMHTSMHRSYRTHMSLHKCHSNRIVSVILIVIVWYSWRRVHHRMILRYLRIS